MFSSQHSAHGERRLTSRMPAKRPGVSGHTSTASQMSTGSPGTSSYKGRKLTDTDKSLCSQNNAPENFPNSGASGGT